MNQPIFYCLLDVICYEVILRLHQFFDPGIKHGNDFLFAEVFLAVPLIFFIYEVIAYIHYCFAPVMDRTHAAKYMQQIRIFAKQTKICKIS